MIALANPELTDAEEAFVYADGLGYALPRQHVLQRWTWIESQRYLKELGEKRKQRAKMSKTEGQVKRVLRGLRNDLGNPEKVMEALEKAFKALDKLFPTPSLLGYSIFSNEEDD